MAKEITFIHVQNNTLTESQFEKIMKSFLKNRKWYLTYNMVKNNPKNNFWFQMGFCHSSDFIAAYILNIAVTMNVRLNQLKKCIVLDGTEFRHTVKSIKNTH